MARGFPVAQAPHARPVSSVPIVMRAVLLALLPGLLALAWSFGSGVFVNLAIAAAAALLAEAAILRLRRQPWRSALADGSALVTAALIAFALPPLLPWWIPALAAAAAIVLGKQVFGGLGANPFNPAMVGYVVVLLSFPVEMIRWSVPHALDRAGIRPDLGDTVTYAFTGRLPDGIGIDAITQATPLDVVRVGLANMQTLSEIRVGPLFGTLGGNGWQTISLCIALGGLYLLYRGIIRWHVPVSVLAGIALPAAVLYSIDSSRYVSPSFHLFNGAAMLGAFFIATDPVTAAGTNRGRLIYGAGIGLLTYAIRTWGGYPDGLAFAVLLMNASVPLLDRYTQPKVYGHD